MWISAFSLKRHAKLRVVLMKKHSSTKGFCCRFYIGFRRERVKLNFQDIGLFQKKTVHPGWRIYGPRVRKISQCPGVKLSCPGVNLHVRRYINQVSGGKILCPGVENAKCPGV